jgi:hypothetical protein
MNIIDLRSFILFTIFVDQFMDAPRPILLRDRYYPSPHPTYCLCA